MADSEAPSGARAFVQLFITRPILALVLSALITLAGAAAFLGIEVRELPAVESPVLSVGTEYGGASPETVDREVTALIEGAVARVPGVRSISSSSTFGFSRVVIEFGSNVDLDTATTDVRDALVRVQGRLPDGAEVPRAVKADTSAETVMRLSLSSPNHSSEELSAIAETGIRDRLLAIEGVADVQLNGAQTPIFRVDVDQAALAARGLTLGDLGTALGRVVLDAPAGTLKSDRQALIVRATADLSDEAGLEALEIAPSVRLGDVARVYFGPEEITALQRTNGQAGVGLSVIRQPQGNSLAITDAVRALVAEVAPTLPEGMRLFVSSDASAYVRGALAEIEKALLIAVLSVAVLVFLFLRDLRATLIPIMAIPVSLIGTLAALWLAGFSLNILTLLACVLATGLVVDDAIVVMENCARLRREGLGARAAALRGTEQVFFAVIATTTTLAAVFLPLSFLPGQTGGLFREFGFTLAIAVAISALVSLTLSPVLAARVLSGGVARGEGWLARVYGRSVRAALAAPLVTLTLALVTALGAWSLQKDLKRELVPSEDRAFIPVSIQAPVGVSLDYTAAKMREVEARLMDLRDGGEVVNIVVVAGTGSENRGFVGLTLAPWGARERSQQEIGAEVSERLKGVMGIRASVGQPNSLGVRGAGQGLVFAVTGDDYAAMAEAARALMARMEEDPGLGQVRIGYDLSQPQVTLRIDRTRAEDLGVDMTGLAPALQALLDGRNVGQIFRGDKSYDIRLVTSSDPVNDPFDLERLQLPTAAGGMVPLSAIATLEERAIAAELGREGLRRAVTVSASLTPDLGLGAALGRVRTLAAEVLPSDMQIVPLAEARLLGDSQAGVDLTFAFALAVVFLVLAAQFESILSALVVMATVPIALACAVFALLATGGSLNLYSQIGLVLVVGIMAKNGILIVEFADQLRAQGSDIRAAIEEAAITRVRPVLMTMLATILGAVPLLFSEGPGAEARRVLGVVIAGGLGPAALATLYLTPVAYLLVARFGRPRSAESDRLSSELAAAARASPGR